MFNPRIRDHLVTVRGYRLDSLPPRLGAEHSQVLFRGHHPRRYLGRRDSVWKVRLGLHVINLPPTFSRLRDLDGLLFSYRHPVLTWILDDTTPVLVARVSVRVERGFTGNIGPHVTCPALEDEEAAEQLPAESEEHEEGGEP